MSVAAGTRAPGASRPIIAITSGEPAGVGPELCLRIVERDWPARLVVLADIELMRARAAALGGSVRVVPFDAAVAAVPGTVEVIHLELARPSTPGKLDAANGAYVLRLLDRAIAGCVAGEFAAMVTAPVHKGVINDAGVAFSGHTEYLAEHTGTPRVVMLLAGTGLRVALATTHLPLHAVPAAITAAGLEATLRILHADLQRKFGIAEPRILVAGLNPHAGEGGHLGREEIEIIAPAIEMLKAACPQAEFTGPRPADTLFHAAARESYDAALCMYHDQALIPLKTIDFDNGVNTTLGLPIVRTSPDHGTALDIAGKGVAHPGSLIAAIKMAGQIAGIRARA